jgi:plastocyanin
VKTLLRIGMIAVFAFALVVPAAAAEQPLGTIDTHRVRMVDGNVFQPGRITIARGDRVRWINRASVTHTTTSNGGLWNETLQPGERFSRRFRRAGTFGYRCTIHAGMTGTIVVR